MNTGPDFLQLKSGKKRELYMIFNTMSKALRSREKKQLVLSNSDIWVGHTHTEAQLR